jgi:hypothetical protein
MTDRLETFVTQLRKDGWERRASTCSEDPLGHVHDGSEVRPGLPKPGRAGHEAQEEAGQLDPPLDPSEVEAMRYAAPTGDPWADREQLPAS